MISSYFVEIHYYCVTKMKYLPHGACLRMHDVMTSSMLYYLCQVVLVKKKENNLDVSGIPFSQCPIKIKWHLLETHSQHIQSTKGLVFLEQSSLEVTELAKSP